MKKHGQYLLIILFLMVMDQTSKMIVARAIPLFKNVRVIPDFFSLTHVRNKGAIFGFFSQSGSPLVHTLLLISSVIALSLIIYYFIKTSPSEKTLKTALALILAGALGNLFDRFVRGYVVDFLDFYVKDWHWPSFNMADSCITVGAVLLMFVFFLKKD